jgi:hypothetical protein
MSRPGTTGAELSDTRVDRRTVLGVTGVTGTTAVAGCLSERTRQAQSEPSPERTSQSGSPTSERTGDYVYYDPDSPGPYSNGKEALAAVPDGGTFQIAAGEYDVSEEGGPLRIERPLHIRGTGNNHGRVVTRSDGNRNVTPVGTILKNTSVDEPAIEFRGNRPEKMLSGVSLTGLTILKGGGDAPAVRFRDTVRSTVQGTRIYTSSATGLKYEGFAFFARAIRSKVHGATDISIHVTGGGYAHEFYSVNPGVSAENATALQTEMNRTIIVGGEFAAVPDGGTAIRFYNPNERPRYGGVVVEPGTEHTDTVLDVDGKSPFENVQLYGAILPMQNGAAVRFGNARNCKVIYPALTSTRPGKLAHWTDQSENCGIITDPGTIENYTYSSAEGAVNPHVHLTGTATREQLANVPTGVATSVDYVVEENGPVFHDGTDWYTHHSASSKMQL